MKFGLLIIIGSGVVDSASKYHIDQSIRLRNINEKEGIKDR